MKIQQIKPGKPWFCFQWAEVWRYKHLIRFLLVRDLRLLYKQTILGPVHLLIRPFAMTLLFQIVFHRIGGFSTDGVHPFLFYFANNSLWAFFSGLFGSSSAVFRSGKTLMSKVYFPRIIPPLTSVLTSGISLLIQLMFLIIVYAYLIVFYQIETPPISSFLILLPIVQVAMISLGIGLLFACITLRYRDLNSLSSVIVQGMMYLSPIVYPFAVIPEKYQLLASFNPLSSAMELFRYFLFGEGTLTIQILGVGWGMTFALFLFGLVAFNVTQRKFIDIV